jgi:hypothetical protein
VREGARRADPASGRVACLAWFWLAWRRCVLQEAMQVRVIEAPCSPLASDRQQCWCPRRLNQVMVMRSAMQAEQSLQAEFATHQATKHTLHRTQSEVEQYSTALATERQVHTKALEVAEEAHGARAGVCLRVRGEIMGSQKCRIVGKSQWVLRLSTIMINPVISSRTRTTAAAAAPVLRRAAAAPRTTSPCM